MGHVAVDELRSGLWRWTTPHPEWTPANDTPSGWKQDVASIAYRAADGRLAVIDPLVRAEPVWAWMAAAPGPVVVLHGNSFHVRSTAEVVARVGATVLPPGSALPPGIEAFPIPGLDAEEIAYYLSGPRALVFADAVIGAGGGTVRVAPPPWSKDPELYGRVFRDQLSRIAHRPIDMVLTSHGPPVLEDGGAALRRAIVGPAWGE
jgi:glyoxylase-like metal-dependent hydrolase (beta-lactamase superfamily II)